MRSKTPSRPQVSTCNSLNVGHHFASSVGMESLFSVDDLHFEKTAITRADA